MTKNLVKVALLACEKELHYIVEFNLKSVCVNNCLFIFLKYAFKKRLKYTGSSSLAKFH